jgi:argininosuccinate lyase
MPQKRNPDAAELVRGKAGRLIGSLMALLVVLKGLPLAYGKDLQEDKEPVFDAADTLELCLAATAAMIAGMSVDRERLAAAAAVGHTTATDLADWLVRRLGVTFREAHNAASQAVRRAEERGVGLAALELEDFRAIEPRITGELLEVLSVECSVASRTSFGGTAPARVREAIRAAKERYL